MKHLSTIIVISLLLIGSLRGQVLFTDDFENGVPGEQVHCSEAEGWMTWMKHPCSVRDPYYSSMESYMGEKALRISAQDDLYHPIDDYTGGKYIIDFWILVKNGHRGFWNAAHRIDNSDYYFALWALYHTDIFIFSTPSQTYQISYEHDVWMHQELRIDLDEDEAFFLHNNELIGSWQWSEGFLAGDPSINQLSALDFYDVNSCDFFIDNFTFRKVSSLAPVSNLTFQIGENYNDILLSWVYSGYSEYDSFNIYRSFDSQDFELIGSTDSTTFEDLNLANGTYQYKVAPVYAGVEDEFSSAIEIEIGFTTVINDNLSEEISISPNPTHGMLNIQFDESADRKIKIINMLGKIIVNRTMNKLSESIDMSDFDSGIYFISIQTGDEVYTSKIVKQ